MLQLQPPQEESADALFSLGLQITRENPFGSLLDKIKKWIFISDWRIFAIRFNFPHIGQNQAYTPQIPSQFFLKIKLLKQYI